MASPGSEKSGSASGLLAVLKSIVLVGARRPFVALAIGALLTAISAALVPGLKISTSRRDLVSKDHPSQRRTLEFDDKFGYSNAPAIIVTGGSKEDRRKVVDALSDELRALPDMDGRVLGRIRPEDVAEVLLVANPEPIAKAIPGEDGGEGAKKLEQGLPGWFDLLDGQLQKGIDADPASVSLEQTRQGFVQLGSLFHALDDELAGENGLVRLADIKQRGELGKGIDDLGYLEGDGKHNIVGMFPELDGDEGYQVRPIVHDIREARDRAIAKSGVSGVRADVTGLPALVSDELAMIERDLAVTSIAATVTMVLTLYWGMRSFRQAMVSFLPLGFGTLVTFGIVRLVLGKLNLITASFTSVLLGLGDFGVHIQRGFSDLLKKGHSPKEAMQESMLHAGPGLLIGTLSVCVAFLTTLVTEFTAFAELGFIVSLGMFVMLAGTYLLVPAAVLLLLGKKPRPSPELPGFRRLATFVRNWPKAICLVAAAISIFFAVGLTKVRFNGRYFEFLPKETESARGLKALEGDTVASPFVANLRAKSIDEARELTTKLRKLDTVASVETASDFFPELDEARLSALKKIVKSLEHDGGPADFAKAKEKPADKAAVIKSVDKLVTTFEDVAFSMRSNGWDAAPAAEDDEKTKADKLDKKRALESVSEAKAQLVALKKRIEATDPAKLTAIQQTTLGMLERAQRVARGVVERGSYSVEDLPAVFQHRFVSRDKTELAIFIHPKGDVWEVPIAEAFTRDVASVSPEVSGIATTLGEHPKLIIRGFEKATVLAAILVLAILTISFRRAGDVFAAALPLVLSSVWMIGAMPLLNMQFNHANMVVLPLLLGLGVEASAHIMSSYRQSMEQHQGKAKLADILGSTGSAVFVAVLTTIFGFSVLMLAQYRAMYGLGLIMTIGMSSTLALSLIVLPAVLVLLKRVE